MLIQIIHGTIKFVLASNLHTSLGSQSGTGWWWKETAVVVAAHVWVIPPQNTSPMAQDRSGDMLK